MAKRSRLTAIAAVAIVALGVCLYVFWPTQRHSVAAPPPPVTTTLPASPTPTPTPPPDPRRPVAAAAPTSFVLTGPAFTVKAKVCPMDYVLPLDPPGDQFHTVCWVRNTFGVAPSYPSTGTSYVLGHAWAEADLVLNPLSTYATSFFTGTNGRIEDGVAVFPVPQINGYTLTLGTPTGSLTYTVTETLLMAKEDAIKVKAIMSATTPDRVVLITCAVKNGKDLDDNVVVFASLTASTPA